MTTNDTTKNDVEIKNTLDLSSTSSLMSSLYCDCLHQSMCQKCGKPMSDRETTKQVIEALPQATRPARAEVFGNGPLFMSDIPASAKNNNSNSQGVILGIDEAGRGSVLGPMVYGMAYWNPSSVVNKGDIPQGFNDSKQMKEEEREKLFKELLLSNNKNDNPNEIGFGFRSLLPNEISRNMLRTSQQRYNLNEMSHDTAMLLIRKLLDTQEVTIATCYIDTVGNPQAYRRKLEREFPGIEFIVESKADAKYAPCSAASVVAKVMRDRFMEGWKFAVPSDSGDNSNADNVVSVGSGYPSDPKCKAWLDTTIKDNPLFGYCDVVRFSWAPAKQRVAEHCVPVVFQADWEDEEDNAEGNTWQQHKQQAKCMSSFLASSTTSSSTRKRKRAPFFEKRQLQAVHTL